MQKRASKLMASLAIAIGFLLVGARPALANHISTAHVQTSCTSYTLQVSAASLVSGKSYTILYQLVYKPGTGNSTTISGSIPFVAPSGGTYATTITRPINLITDTYQLTGKATLVGENTIPVSFAPATLVCDCPD